MKTYRLVDFNGFDSLQLKEEEEPRPVRGEVLIRVRAAALNYRDLAMAVGQYPPDHRAGLIPLSDAAGDVVAVGDGVTSLSVGDRVISCYHPRWFGGRAPENESEDQYGSSQDGWLTEYKVVSQEAVVSCPARLSYEEASTLPCAALTAWTALTAGAPVGPGHTVLTEGTGGVALFAVQLAKLAGANVISTTSSERKASVLRKLGADHVINYSDEPEWGLRARLLAGNQGVDRIVDVGGAGTLPEAMRAIRPGGEIAVIGFLDSPENAGLDFIQLFLSGATFRVINVGHRSALSELVAALEQAEATPVIDSIHTFENAADGYRRLASGAAVGKVVITI